MTLGALSAEGYQPSFSGHETFPLRYGWLKKAYDAVAETALDTNNRQLFLGSEAISRFGVGKNMVAAIRHWATQSGVIRETPKTGHLLTTSFGDLLFGSGGIDPFLEDPASLWFIHWNLCSKPNKTTWFWVFNHFPGYQFKREHITEKLIEIARSRGWQRVARTTVHRDVECLLRMYAVSGSSGEATNAEDLIESPLAELGLIRGMRGSYDLVRGRKRNLSNRVFAFALDEYWNSRGERQSLSFESIAHEAGSPGRVFLLDESTLIDHLLLMHSTTDGLYHWSETAGLKQVLRERPLSEKERQSLLRGPANDAVPQGTPLC